tara:strand:- start:560 stop:697 length:138 start_codon:yes stop_codon:yes gene_type:complete
MNENGTNILFYGANSNQGDSNDGTDSNQGVSNVGTRTATIENAKQ